MSTNTNIYHLRVVFHNFTSSQTPFYCPNKVKNDKKIKNNTSEHIEQILNTTIYYISQPWGKYVKKH